MAPTTFLSTLCPHFRSLKLEETRPPEAVVFSVASGQTARTMLRDRNCPDERGFRMTSSAEDQPGGAARNHVRRRVCPQPRDDPWHHGGVRHA